MAETYLSTFNFILIVGVIQGFFFNIVIFSTNKFKDKAILFLSLTVLFLSINNLQSWFIDENFEISFYYMKYFKLTWNVFLAPMFYLFLVNYLKIENYLKRLFLITIALFVSSILIRILFLYYLKSQEGSSEFVFYLKRYNSIEDISIFIYTISIFTYSSIIFFTQHKRFKLISSYDNLKWIKTFFVLSSVVLSFWLIAIVLNYYYVAISTSYFYSPLRISTSFLIYWIGYQGLYQQKFVQDRMIIRSRLKNQEFVDDDILKISNKKNTTDVNYSKRKVQFKEINQFVITKKKYTDASLSLESLASDINISSSLLSQLINTYSDNNFTDYINKHRIELVKELLIDENYKNYTILSIGLESGFNSKSTFYAAFKKHTNLTPAEYKKELLQHKFVRNNSI